MSEMASYHDLHIETDLIPRISIFNLPFNYQVSCFRASGWQLWDHYGNAPVLVAGEFHDKGLRLDVSGVVICDSLSKANHNRDRE